MDRPEFLNDRFHQAFLHLLSKRQVKVSEARSAGRRGDVDRARVLEGHVADYDEMIESLKRLLSESPGWTRESFGSMLSLATKGGCDDRTASIIALQMVVEMGQTAEAFRQNHDIVGLIESSRIAPDVLSPEEELRLWNEKGITVEEQQELWRQGLDPYEIAKRLFPHREKLMKAGGRALSIAAQAKYADEMARKSVPDYDPIALRRQLYPDAGGTEQLSAVPAELDDLIPTADTTSVVRCSTPKCRMCRLVIGDPEVTRVRLRDVLDLVDKGWKSPALCDRWDVAPSTVRDWVRAARHRRDLGTL